MVQSARYRGRILMQMFSAERTATWLQKFFQKARVTIQAPIGFRSVVCCINYSRGIVHLDNIRLKINMKSIA